MEPYQNLATPPIIKDSYPKLLNELNDANSEIPAYMRFQRQNQSPLRDDLKNIKADHFK